MISKQQQGIKSFIVDTNNCLNGIFPSFNSLNIEFCPGQRLIDLFSSYFPFHKADHHNKESKVAYCKKLNKLILNVSSEPNTVVIILNTSIKNNITISIAYVHSFNNLMKKILHHTINITFMEVELVALKCKINQAVQIPNSSHIIIIINTLHVT